MCNRARTREEPETWREKFGAKWLADRPTDNRFDPRELRPGSRNWVIREDERGRGVDVMSWDVLGGQAKWAMTNVRNLELPQRCRLAAEPHNRCLIPLTEFCEWTPEAVDLGDGKKPIKGEVVCGHRPADVRDRRFLAADGERLRLHDGDLRS